MARISRIIGFVLIQSVLGFTGGLTMMGNTGAVRKQRLPSGIGDQGLGLAICCLNWDLGICQIG